jgi:hypothetical protein
MQLAHWSIELQAVKECDATGDDSSIAAKCKKNLHQGEGFFLDQ